MLVQEWSKLHPVPLHNVKIDRSLCKVKKKKNPKKHPKKHPKKTENKPNVFLNRFFLGSLLCFIVWNGK